MKYCLLTIVATGLAGLPSGNGLADVKDYRGRWNLEIQETGDTFSTAWLQISEEKAGAWTGALVWKWRPVAA